MPVANWDNAWTTFAYHRAHLHRHLILTICDSKCHAVQAIEAFQKDPPTTVFLLSMRSGAVGINLTSANYVFVLEPALNPGLEEQAVGRAWRMGQQRPVTVKKLYVKVLPSVSSGLCYCPVKMYMSAGHRCCMTLPEPMLSK